MSKAEILAELPVLTPEDRREIAARIEDLERDGWYDDGELTDDEKRIIESRLDACEKDPGNVVAWEDAKARLRAQFAQ